MVSFLCLECSCYLGERGGIKKKSFQLQLPSQSYDDKSWYVSKVTAGQKAFKLHPVNKLLLGEQSTSSH